MNKTMFRTFSCALMAWGLTTARAESESEVEFQDVSVSGQFDNGQIVQGATNKYDNPPSNVSVNGEFFTRTGVWITQSAIVNKKLKLIMGAGGVFWYSLPQREGDPVSRQTLFGPGISQAQGIYSFGDPEEPYLRLQAGLFPYKYNEDAKNLGEYLMRSGTYPGYLVTGGWNMVSSAAYMTQGVRLGLPLWDGKFQSDFILAMERDLPPLFDITPAYVGTLRPWKWLRLQGGVAFNHLIPVRPSRVSPKVEANEIITKVDTTYVPGALIDPTDPSKGNLPGEYTYAFTTDSTSHYTFQGTKLMAGFSLDPKGAFDIPFLGPEDLKIYGEIAVLGWKDYPYYYEKRAERMPVMFGMNIPAFKLLDVLSLEVEHYNNTKFTNNIKYVAGGATPRPFSPEVETGTLSEDDLKKNLEDIKNDNWKWSLYGRKEITKGIRLYGQVASDHIRTFRLNVGPLPAMVPITNQNGKDWYYILRLEFGI